MNHKGIQFFKGVQDLQVNVVDFDNKSVKYHVRNTPICQYDQHSRARVGVKFQSYEIAEEPEYVLYTNLYNKIQQNEDFKDKVCDTLLKLENRRNFTSNQVEYNLMSRNCQYFVIQDLTSLNGQMSRRLQFCEEEFIVGLHWLLRDKLIKLDVKIAEHFLPECDSVNKCTYATADALSNCFGCLFKSCGRWPYHAEFASFNQSCTTPSILEEQLKIKIPKSQHEIHNKIR